MIKGLFLTNIPKDEQCLKKALTALKCDMWSKETIEAWVNCNICNFVIYDFTYNTYLWSVTGKKDISVKHRVVEYKRLVER